MSRSSICDAAFFEYYNAANPAPVREKGRQVRNHHLGTWRKGYKAGEQTAINEIAALRVQVTAAHAVLRLLTRTCTAESHSPWADVLRLARNTLADPSIDASGVTNSLPVGRCLDCVHYDTTRDETLGGFCDMAKNDGYEPADRKHPDSLAVAQDGDFFTAWLQVSPNFGCVQFSRRLEKSDAR